MIAVETPSGTLNKHTIDPGRGMGMDDDRDRQAHGKGKGVERVFFTRVAVTESTDMTIAMCLLLHKEH